MCKYTFFFSTHKSGIYKQEPGTVSTKQQSDYYPSEDMAIIKFLRINTTNETDIILYVPQV